MTTKLVLYNKALFICKERKLVTVTDATKSRYLLDEVYDESIQACLESGLWRFARRSSEIDYDTGIDPLFGYQYAFAKPSDWAATIAVCTDEYYRSPLLDYVFEAGYWYADTEPLYVMYVSNHADYGLNLSGWSELFADFVAAHMADKIVGSLTSDDKLMERVAMTLKKNKSSALNHDAMSGPTKTLPHGSWVNSRRSGGSREGGGNRGDVIA